MASFTSQSVPSVVPVLHPPSLLPGREGNFTMANEANHVRGLHQNGDPRRKRKRKAKKRHKGARSRRTVRRQFRVGFAGEVRKQAKRAGARTCRTLVGALQGMALLSFLLIVNAAGVPADFVFESAILLR